MADRVYLLECKPLDPASGTIKNAYFSAGLTTEADLGTADPYPVRLQRSFSHETSVFEDNMPGQTNTSVGSAVILNTDGRFDYLLNYNWDNRAVTIKSGEEGAAYATYVTEFVGVTLELTTDLSSLVLTLKDNSYKLIEQMQKTKFLGSGAQEGGVELRDRRKPLLFGKTRNLSPVLIDIALLTSQIHDGTLASVDAVYDRGVPLTFSANYATYALLAAATIAPGYYATCLAQGYLRLGAPPYGIVTVDAVGQFNTATNIPEMVKQFLLSTRVGLVTADIDVASFTEASGECPYNFEGAYLAEPDFQVDQFVETMASSMNAFWYVSRTGLITFRQFRFRPSSASIRAEDLMNLGKAASPQPLHKVRVKYAKNATVMSQGDFTIPVQAFNGYLTKRYHYVDISSGEIPANYANAGEYKVFLNDVQVNDLSDVQFRIPNNEPWITIDNLGVITVTNSGVASASAVVRASIGEFSVEEVFTMVRDSSAPLQSMSLTLSSNRFFFDDLNKPDPPAQTITITATGSNTTAPITVTAKDNLNQNVVVTGGTIPIANVSVSPLVFYIEVTAVSVDMVYQKQRIMVQHGTDAAIAATLAALAASNDAITFYYQANAPTVETDGVQVDDVWIDTNDGNKQYRWTGISWSSITDTRVTDALAAAAGAQATADGKITTYFSDVSPTAPTGGFVQGDLWYQDTTKTLYRWSGSAWSQSVGTFGAEYYETVYGKPLSEVLIDEMEYKNSTKFAKRWLVREGEGIINYDQKDKGVQGGAYLRITSPTVPVELVTNGTFPTATTGWTAGPNTTLSIGAQALRVTTTSTVSAYAYQAITCVVGKTYSVSYENNERIATSVIFQIANDSAGTSTVYSDTTERSSVYTSTFVATQTTHYIRCVAVATISGRYADFDNISIMQTAPGDIWLSYVGEPVPFDPAASYEVEIAIRRPSGDGKVNLGLEGLADDKVTLVSRTGTNSYTTPHWICAAAATPNTGWTYYKGYFKGRSGTGSATAGTIDVPGVMHTNVVYIRPVMQLNYQATSGVMDVGYVRVRKTQMIDQLPDGTHGKIYKSQLTNYAHKLTVVASGMQIADQRNLPPVKALNLGFKYGGTVTYSTTTTLCTINITASSFTIGNITVAYNAMSTTISGTAGTGPFTYYLYFDDAGYVGGAKTLLKTTNSLLIYQSDDRVFMGTVVFSFPSAGTGGGDGDVGGGGCVDAEAWVDTRDKGFIQAKEIVEGDYIRVLSADRKFTEWAPVLGNEIKMEESFQLVSRTSGSTLRCSASTPLTLSDGSSVYPGDLKGQELPVYVTELAWEKHDAIWIGPRPVAFIHLGGLCYAAGDIPGRSIFTHNPIENPKP